MKFSNPRTKVTIDNWPFGKKRVFCRFEIEKNSKGQRILRMTENKTSNGWNKPKMTTYGRKAAIVDGDDGKTYILMLVKDFDMIQIILGTMKSSRYVHAEDPEYDELLRIINRVSEEIYPVKQES